MPFRLFRNMLTPAVKVNTPAKSTWVFHGRSDHQLLPRIDGMIQTAAKIPRAANARRNMSGTAILSSDADSVAGGFAACRAGTCGTGARIVGCRGGGGSGGVCGGPV